MCLPRVRFTVRRLIVAVLIAGALAWTAGLYRLSRRYSRLSNIHEWRLDNHAYQSAHDPERMRSYHYEMMNKYRILTFSPWNRVPLEPPEPE